MSARAWTFRYAIGCGKKSNFSINQTFYEFFRERQLPFLVETARSHTYPLVISFKQARADEELVFKRLFGESVKTQQQQLREYKKIAAEVKERRLQSQRDQLDSMENYYRFASSPSWKYLLLLCLSGRWHNLWVYSTTPNPLNFTLIPSLALTLNTCNPIFLSIVCSLWVYFNEFYVLGAFSPLLLCDFWTMSAHITPVNSIIWRIQNII